MVLKRRLFRGLASAGSSDAHLAMLTRALYRASMRCVKSLNGQALPLQRSINETEWGKYRRLSPQQLETERESVFPWAFAAVEPSDYGTITSSTLMALLRRRYREPLSTADEADNALNDGFAALRNFAELYDRLKTSSISTTRGVRIEAVSKYLGLADDSGAHVRQ